MRAGCATSSINWADNTLFPSILFLVIPDLLDVVGDAKLKANREKLIGMTTAQMRERHAPHAGDARRLSAR